MGDDEVGTGGGSRGDDAFEGLTLDDSFVRGAALNEGSHRDREKDARRQRRRHRRGNRARRTGRWFRRYTPLLLAAVVLVATVGFGSRGQGPLGQLDAVRRLGGLEPVESVAAPSAPGPSGASASPTTAADGAGTTSTTRQLTIDDRDPGTCVMWDASLAPSLQANSWSVPCEEPHRFEVVAEVQLDGSPYGPSGPSADEWSQLIQSQCLERAREYYGQPIDLAGRYGVSAVRPSTDTWAAGDREMLCGIGRAPSSDEAEDLTMTGSVLGTDQYVILPVGTCAARSGDGFPTAVACDQVHEFEVVEIVDVSELGAGYPTPESIIEAIRPECSAAVTRVYGAPPSNEVRFGSLGIAETSWNAGRRSIECFLGVHDGTTWRTVTGPVRAGGGWTAI